MLFKSYKITNSPQQYKIYFRCLLSTPPTSGPAITGRIKSGVTGTGMMYQ